MGRENKGGVIIIRSARTAKMCLDDRQKKWMSGSEYGAELTGECCKLKRK